MFSRIEDFNMTKLNVAISNKLSYGNLNRTDAADTQYSMQRCSEQLFIDLAKNRNEN